MKKLSVIIPVYGTEKYIDKCITSALMATDDVDAEIIVVNDGTKDNAGIIAQRYATDNPDRIIYLEKENSGLADTKNYGLKHARGEFVTFIDSDDYIEPEMYIEMLAIADNERADCVVCDMIFDFEDSDKKVYQKCVSNSNDIFRKIIDHPLMASSCNKIMKKELLSGLTFPSGKNNEDIAVTPIALGRSKRLAYSSKGFYHYVQRSGSIQRVAFSKKKLAVLDVCKLALDRAGEFSGERYEIIKEAIYVYQILLIPFYFIRKEPLLKRYLFLKEYMSVAEKSFPDIYDNGTCFFQNNEKSKWGNLYRKNCLFFLQHKLYFLVTIVFGLVNLVKSD